MRRHDVIASKAFDVGRHGLHRLDLLLLSINSFSLEL